MDNNLSTTQATVETPSPKDGRKEKRARLINGLMKRKSEIHLALIAAAAATGVATLDACVLKRTGTCEAPCGSNEGGSGGGVAGGGGIGGGETGGTGGTGAEGGTGGTGGEGGGTGGEGGSACVPTGPEVCDGIDNDCQNGIDDNLTPPQCAELDTGVCQGATAARFCDGVNGWSQCSYEVDPDYQPVTELTCDGKDNNCDSTVDESCLTLDATTCHKFAHFLTNVSTTFEAGSSADDNNCDTSEITVMTTAGNRVAIWVRDVDNITLTTDAAFTCYKDCSVNLQPPTHSEMLNDLSLNSPFVDVADSQVNGPITVWTNPDVCPRYLFVCDR